jgi:hypothetical protein
MSVPTLIEFELWSKGDWPRRDVVGESFHELEIRSLFPARIGEQDRELSLRAALVPDPRNEHDRNAVKVIASGQHIGHLAKDDAAKYQPLFNTLAQRGFLPVTNCRIRGSEYDEWVGTDRRGREITRPKFACSVSLTLDEWYLCVPVNQPPTQPHTILPHGSALQVRKEEDHQDTLRRYVSRQGECWVYATLHAVTDTTTRKPKELAEIRIDDQRVGELTSAMSAEYIPIISQLNDRSRLTAVKLIVKGNQVRAEAVLHAAKAHQLDAAWISTNLPVAIHQPDIARRALQPDGTPRVVTHAPIPPKPTRIRFCIPPGWPPARHGWEPGPGWRPNPSWPPAPANWEYWRAEE